MRWGIRYATESGATDLLESRWGTLDEAREACRIRRERRPSIAYRVVRLTTRSDRLQRELDQARCRSRAWKEATIATRILARALAETVEDLTQERDEALEALSAESAERVVVHRDVKPGNTAARDSGDKADPVALAKGLSVDLGRSTERRLIVEALLRCTRGDLPSEVDEMVRARVLARDLTSRTVVRETAAILATWIARGAR